MAVERSRSGIGAPIPSQGMISPLAGGANFASIQNQHQLNLFNTTVARNLRGRTNSNLNQASSAVKAQVGQIPEFNLTNAFGLSTLSPSQAKAARGLEGQLNEQYVKKHAHASPAPGKMGVSGSQLKIPTITLHNQSFYNQKVSPRHFTKDRQPNHSNSRSPELSNVASGYLKASPSNTIQ